MSYANIILPAEEHTVIKSAIFLFVFLASLCLSWESHSLCMPHTSLAASSRNLLAPAGPPVLAAHNLSDPLLSTKNPSASWKIIWEDNFDDPSLSTAKWNIIDWAAEKNNELEYYTPDNVSLTNGNLCIITEKKQYNGRSFTSGAIETKDKFHFLYGKAEIRAKLPKGKGIFPAFWMLAQNDSDLPEIDIMEMIGDYPSEIWMVYHWLDGDEQKRNYTSYTGPDFSEDYHIFSIEWSSDKMVWLIDNAEVFSTDHAPNQPMFLYINTAVGGVWPGSPDTKTIFPQSLLVDYVRIYKENLACAKP